MSTINLKRSIAALAVTAGLLAAATPASAAITQDMQTSRTSSLENTMVSGYNIKPAAVVVLIGANDYGFADTSRVEAENWAPSDSDVQGLIMSDGRICDPIRHMGC